MTLRVSGVNGATLSQKLAQLSAAQKSTILKEDTSGVAARVLPKKESRNGELARNIGELAARETWRIEELHTEEGRLDDVFRSITLPETSKEKLP